MDFKYSDLVEVYSKVGDELKTEKEKCRSLEKDLNNKLKTHEEEVSWHDYIL